MAVSSRKTSGPVLRSPSPSGRFSSSSSMVTASSPFASSSFSTPSPSMRFSFDNPVSPRRSISASSRSQVMKKPVGKQLANQKRTCMCSPTNHPGSFRCSFHKNLNCQTASFPSNRLNARRSAMTNSLVRIGTVEGDLVRRALAALIRPSSHQQKRRALFQPRRSRLSNMFRAEDL